MKLSLASATRLASVRAYQQRQLAAGSCVMGCGAEVYRFTCRCCDGKGVISRRRCLRCLRKAAAYQAARRKR